MSRSIVMSGVAESDQSTVAFRRQSGTEEKIQEILDTLDVEPRSSEVYRAPVYESVNDSLARYLKRLLAYKERLLLKFCNN
ncbi:hypothetical protein OESDEN_03623 [Oesophagostomum dentatum]|uniref:Uncharacterized protein n=1 Tax=Oesophagostomum dentatum TaxID=61180 RepID=A0A0B1TGL8_OESDE|nr:hypothetical protein OESDEN_03623 [Oesophagostomum dentatum]